MKESNMNITIQFFQRDLIPAIGAGIYEISVYKNDESRVLYIGESVFVLVRCASHLYELNKDPKYFGFTEETIRDSDVKLKFRLLEKVNKRDLRKKREKELIKEKAPLTQSGISDYQKSVEDKISALTSFLNSSFTNI
ncbi:MAG: hypothetical protein M3043_16690 [Lysinibacillus fusiformis]|uniref:hypothetical protein n=1 Tax=Metasolibacillus sp. TaxID=2703680 RepID=UPI0025FB84F9|nr:hypothetical protein [Metasolibacillus sp.]MCT6818034.1 hypothetical protein [Lysinibacillus fusiformis]MCT6924226.1 hypothetical protein [Metasolibacillus sp.]MCT6940372.1 hypothetical protein [Metasolibacillus sp.]